jgi:excisionase family DNA binding protein
MKSIELLSTMQAAERLGITRQRVFDLIESGRLPAFKIGRAYAIYESDLQLVAERKIGRPPKTETQKVKAKTSKSASKRRQRKK